MPSRFGVWSVGRLLLLAAALGGTFLLFFGVALRVALRARVVQVPTVVGKTVNDASQTLGALGLTLRSIRRGVRMRTLRPIASCCRIRPAGAAARTPRSIRVWLSAGPRTTTVPQLIGQTERTARIRMEQDGVELGSVSEFRSPDYAADAVVSQDPPPEVKAPKVSLLLNRGEAAITYVMPDVIGMDGNRVSDALRAQGFRVTITGSQPYPGIPPGTVVRQQPQGGFRVAASDPISLEVSR
jgi:serine/threonine-protein kinase